MDKTKLKHEVTGTQYLKTFRPAYSDVCRFFIAGFLAMKKQYISLIPGLLLIFFLSCEKKGTASPELILFSDTIDWAWELGEFYGGNSFYWWHNTEKGVFDMGDMPPDCWTGPDDFEHGQFHLRFEIIEQPSNQPFFIQLGFWQDMHAEGGHSETISSRILIRNGKGSLVEAELGSAASWWELQADKAVDFCKVGAFDRIGLALWKAEPLASHGQVGPTARHVKILSLLRGNSFP